MEKSLFLKKSQFHKVFFMRKHLKGHFFEKTIFYLMAEERACVYKIPQFGDDLPPPNNFCHLRLCPPPLQRFWPERSGMAPEWLKWTENKLFWRIKQFKVWFWGFWDDFWRSENFDLQYHNGPPLWWSRSKVLDLQKSSQNPQTHILNAFIR